MAKDPAFLFYSSDFLTGTMFMTNEEVGQYVRTLCLLHQHGGCLPLNKIEKAVGTLTTPTLEKLSKNQHGYFNNRLTLEIKKRKEYSISRRNNRLGKKKSNKICKTHDKSYVSRMTTHMEDENEDENKDININRNKAIITDLNEVLGTSYKPISKTKELIQVRFNEGFTIEDFKTVHRRMLKCWGADDEMYKYLRPITLYSNKFESYLNMREPFTKLSEAGVKAYLVGREWLKKQEVIDVRQG